MGEKLEAYYCQKTGKWIFPDDGNNSTVRTISLDIAYSVPYYD
jgi:hypothetical protein